MLEIIRLVLKLGQNYAEVHTRYRYSTSRIEYRFGRTAISILEHNTPTSIQLWTCSMIHFVRLNLNLNTLIYIQPGFIALPSTTWNTHKLPINIFLSIPSPSRNIGASKLRQPQRWYVYLFWTNYPKWIDIFSVIYQIFSHQYFLKSSSMWYTLVVCWKPKKQAKH